MFKKKIKTQDSLNIDRARIRSSPCLNYSAIGLSLHTVPRATSPPPILVLFVGLFRGKLFPLDTRRGKGKDSGEVSQRPALLAGAGYLVLQPQLPQQPKQKSL